MMRVCVRESVQDQLTARSLARCCVGGRLEKRLGWGGERGGRVIVSLSHIFLSLTHALFSNQREEAVTTGRKRQQGGGGSGVVARHARASAKAFGACKYVRRREGRGRGGCVGESSWVLCEASECVDGRRSARGIREGGGRDRAGRREKRGEREEALKVC